MAAIRNVLLLGLSAFMPLATSFSSAVRATTDPPLDTPGLEPYILIGESGKSVERTAKEIIGRLFMQNFEILGRYAPADDPHRQVIIVTQQQLLQALPKLKSTGVLAAAIRIAITQEGDLTYIVCQNPSYWASAYLQDDFPLLAERFLPGSVMTSSGPCQRCEAGLIALLEAEVTTR